MGRCQTSLPKYQLPTSDDPMERVASLSRSVVGVLRYWRQIHWETSVSCRLRTISRGTSRSQPSRMSPFCHGIQDSSSPWHSRSKRIPQAVECAVQRPGRSSSPSRGRPIRRLTGIDRTGSRPSQADECYICCRAGRWKQNRCPENCTTPDRKGWVGILMLSWLWNQ